MLKILLVDDHEVVRLGLKSLLSHYPKFEVVAEAGGDHRRGASGAGSAEAAGGPSGAHGGAPIAAAERGEGSALDGDDGGAAVGIRPAHSGPDVEVAEPPADDLTDDPWFLYQKIARSNA